MQSLCTAHTVWDSQQLQRLLGQELTDMGAHWTKGEKCSIWREHLSIPQSPKHHGLETVVMQALISKSTNWNTNVWQSQLLARAHPALLLPAPKPAGRPARRAQKSPIFSRDSAAPHFTPLHHTAPFTLTYQIHMVCLNLGQLDPRLKQILQKRYIPSHSWQPDPKLHSPPLQEGEAAWKLHLKWGVWLRLEPLFRTAPANIRTLTSPLVLLWTVCSQNKINPKILAKKFFSSHYKKYVLSEDLGCFTAVLSFTCTSFTTLKWADESGEEGENMGSCS